MYPENSGILHSLSQQNDESGEVHTNIYIYLINYYHKHKDTLAPKS